MAIRTLYVDDEGFLSIEDGGTRVPLNASLLGRLAPDLIGPPGPGVPDGGTTRQVLTKASDDDQDTEWSDPAAGLADDTIENRHVKAAAAIALSKLATDPLARANHTGTQRASTISDFDAAAQAALVAGLATKADLVGGLVPSSQLPALALTDVSVVTSQVEQLALTAQEGDVAIRSDQGGRPYMHNGGRAGDMTDWTVLDATAAVLSVNGQTGTVVLSAADVGALDASAGAGGVLRGTYPNPGFATDPFARANHTGTQTASTISDFATQVSRSALSALAVPTADVAWNSRKITGLADPASAQDAATKAYVDAKAKTIRTVHTVALQGAVTTAAIPGFFVAAASGQTVRLVKVRRQIGSGTSASFRVQKNGADISGFGTSGAPLVARTTAGDDDPTDVTLAADDLLTVVVSAISGSPTDLVVTLVLEHTIV